MTKLWAAAISLVNRLFGIAKSAIIYYAIKESTENKIENVQLKKNNERQKKQLDISSSPRAGWSDLLERMRNDKL